MIDIIIPCYRAQDCIYRCLSSIVIQKMLEECTITCVVDGEDIAPYEEVARKFKPYMNIRVIGYEENKGAGLCRNYGIDHTNEPYIIFIDADDVFNGIYAIQSLRNGIEGYDVCYGNFIYEDKNSVRVSSEFNCVHGKIYKREFLDKRRGLLWKFRANKSRLW